MKQNGNHLMNQAQQLRQHHKGKMGGGYIMLDSRSEMTATIDKPAYQVPSMTEIESIPWNGFKVASTFSGCGGSCLGYRMAGFKVVWANEFVPAAQDSYNANKADDCYLDPRDIRLVKPEEILKRLKMEPGELDLFDGSPPCQAFSTAGKREKGWGKLKEYEHGARQCNEQLFTEYIRLLRGLKPKVFVAENVSGLIKGTAKGMFLEILKDLKDSGYRVKCKLLDAQWLGVPQMRQRTIFVGVRDDLETEPAFPKPMKYRYSVRDALPEITGGPFLGPKVTAEYHRTKVGKNNDRFFQLQKVDRDQPSPTLTGPSGTGLCLDTEARRFSIAELKRICAFPDDFILTGSYAQQWERLGNSVPPVMMKHISESCVEILRKIQ